MRVGALANGCSLDSRADRRTEEGTVVNRTRVGAVVVARLRIAARFQVEVPGVPEKARDADPVRRPGGNRPRDLTDACDADRVVVGNNLVTVAGVEHGEDRVEVRAGKDAGARVRRTAARRRVREPDVRRGLRFAARGRAVVCRFERATGDEPFANGRRIGAVVIGVVTRITRVRNAVVIRIGVVIKAGADVAEVGHAVAIGVDAVITAGADIAKVGHAVGVGVDAIITTRANVARVRNAVGIGIDAVIAAETNVAGITERVGDSVHAADKEHLYFL